MLTPCKMRGEIYNVRENREVDASSIQPYRTIRSNNIYNVTWVDFNVVFKSINSTLIPSEHKENNNKKYQGLLHPKHLASGQRLPLTRRKSVS
jgi:hypothetical protein